MLLLWFSLGTDVSSRRSDGAGAGAAASAGLGLARRMRVRTMLSRGESVESSYDDETESCRRDAAEAAA